MGLIRRRSAVLFTATALAGAAFAIEPAVMRDLSVDTGQGRVTVGAVRTSLWAAAFAQAADTLVLDNVSVTIGPITYRAKRIEFAGAAMTRADAEALFDKNASEPLAARLARISARQITIPELVTEQQVGEARQRAVQSNVVLATVNAGKVATLTIDGTVSEGGTPQARTRLTQGRTTLTDLDAAGLARIYAERGGPNAPMTKIYGAFTLEDTRVSGPDGMEFRIARMAGRDFHARPIEDSWAGVISLMTELGAIENPSEQDTNRLMVSVADMLGSFDMAQAEINGIEIRPPKSAQNGTGRIARMAYTGAVGGQTPDARIEGFEVAASDGTARVATIAFTGFSFQPTLDGLKSLKGRSIESVDPAELRKLVPTIGTVRFSGLDFDLPNEESKGPKPDRIRFTLKNLEMTADKPVDGVPTNVRLALQNLAMPIAANTKEEGLKDLAALGYKALDLSFTTAASWNEPGQELIIREVSTQVAEMGSVSMRGVLGSVSKDVFSTDSAVAMVALVGATAKNFDVTVENGGLFDRYLAQESKKQKKSAESIRRELGTTAAIGIPALLGPSAQAKAIGQAVAKFVAKPGRLVISARTKDPVGLGFADVVSVSEPAELLEKLEISATTE